MRRLFRLQKVIVYLLAASFILGMLLGIGMLSSKDSSTGLMDWFSDAKKKTVMEQEKHPGELEDGFAAEKFKSKQDEKVKDIQKEKEVQKESQPEEKKELVFPAPNYNLHAFYYPWYGNPQFDSKYFHWNHPQLKHWDKKTAAKWPQGVHKPPEDIGSNYFPALGPYSSRDPNVINNHMEQMRSAGIGVLAVSWFPSGLADDNGTPWSDLIPIIMDAAHKYQLMVCFHLEPYKSRTAPSVRNDIKTIMSRHGSHPAFYKHTHMGKELPVYYIYDSYLIPKDQWATIFRPDGSKSLRDSPNDGIFIGLLVEEMHKVNIVSAGFDGFYTYFASDGFSFGSSTRNWVALAGYARANNLLFIPSAGPGYVDTRVRPWNDRNTKDRENGGYYEQSMKAAVAASAPIISITSFNEWHEGTQIEKAVPHTDDKNNFKYKDYKPMEPDYYLSLTRKWSFKFAKMLRERH